MTSYVRAKVKKFLKAGLFLIPVLILQFIAIPTSATAEPTPSVATNPANSSSPITTIGSSATLAVTAATTPCVMKADYVHWSESVPGSIKANAWVECTGTTFTITSFQVTLYKGGLIPHYITGPSISGIAKDGIKFWYLVFPTACSSSTSSSYWSKAVVYGYYAGDPSLSTGTSWSTAQPLDCGTTW